MPKQTPSIRLRLANAILGSKKKEYIQALSPMDGSWLNDSGRLNNYATKDAQLLANVGWCAAANDAIVEACSSVELKLYRKKKDGDKEEIKEHEILDLLDTPNLAHTGEQLRQLHETYMNFTGEGYLYMTDLRGNPHIPSKGRLPAALQVFPAHRVQFTLGETYSKSTIRYGKDVYPAAAFIRDLKPDPGNPYYGRSIIAAAAATIDTENQMKEWNRRLFANNARPSLIFKTNEQLSDASYERWKQQFNDEHTGAENAYKPILIEGGDATPYMMNQQDLDFLASREFSMKEILSMWKVSPGMLGQVENVNRSNLDSGLYIHALLNTVPRLRRWVRQVNSVLVAPYDASLELGFDNPVPEDEEVNLSYAKAANGNNAWLTIDEVRDLYGEKPLPDGLGDQVYLPSRTATLDEIANTEVPPANDAGDENVATPPAATPPPPKKSLDGVKKKP